MADPLNRACGTTTVANAEMPFLLERGGQLNHVEIAWESYGTLNDDRSNVVFVCHALTGNQRAAGEEGWWKPVIGPGCAIDTDHWFVICSNVLGGRDGSTGPCSIDPATGQPYGSRFPRITVRDIVRAQRLLLERLGISRLALVMGGSMGAMQTLQWCVEYPNDLDSAIAIAAGSAHSAWSVAFGSVAREAIELGRKGGDVGAGLRLARAVAMISYRGDRSFTERFGRDSGRNEDRFAVEEWLEHHGHRLVARFDADTYATLTRAMDSYDLNRHGGLASVRAQVLTVGISSDLLYPTHEVRAVAGAIPDARYCEIESPHGHDAFLIEFDQLDEILRKEVFSPSSLVIREAEMRVKSPPSLTYRPVDLPTYRLSDLRT